MAPETDTEFGVIVPLISPFVGATGAVRSGKTDRADPVRIGLVSSSSRCWPRLGFSCSHFPIPDPSTVDPEAGRLFPVIGIASEFPGSRSRIALPDGASPTSFPQSDGKLERWHGSLRHECIRADFPSSSEEARCGITASVDCYNSVRLHSTIGYITPADKLQ